MENASPSLRVASSRKKGQRGTLAAKIISFLYLFFFYYNFRRVLDRLHTTTAICINSGISYHLDTPSMRRILLAFYYMYRARSQAVSRNELRAAATAAAGEVVVRVCKVAKWRLAMMERMW